MPAALVPESKTEIGDKSDIGDISCKMRTYGHKRHGITRAEIDLPRELIGKARIKLSGSEYDQTFDVEKPTHVIGLDDVNDGETYGICIYTDDATWKSIEDKLDKIYVIQK